jgi:predicted nucleotidyltransferase
MKKDQMIERLKACLPAILADRPVLLAYAYGSMVSGYAMPSSDIDIALVLRSSADLTPYERVHLELDIEIDIEAQCDVLRADVRSIDPAPLRVQGKVVTHGLLLYCADEAARVAYEARIRKQYLDLQPTLAQMRTAYFADLISIDEGS